MNIEYCRWTKCFNFLDLKLVQNHSKINNIKARTATSPGWYQISGAYLVFLRRCVDVRNHSWQNVIPKQKKPDQHHHHHHHHHHTQYQSHGSFRDIPNFFLEAPNLVVHTIPQASGQKFGIINGLGISLGREAPTNFQTGGVRGSFGEEVKPKLLRKNMLLLIVQIKQRLKESIAFVRIQKEQW